jgi:hypothetical protein
MNKEDIKIGQIFRQISSIDMYGVKTFRPYFYRIIEITAKGFKYELMEKEKYPNGISWIPRWGMSFTGEGEAFVKDEMEYTLDFYEIVENTYDI